MGGSSSKTSVELVNEAVTNVVLDVAKNCNSTVGQIQSVRFGEVAGDLNFSGNSFRQQATVSLKCIMESGIQNDIISKIAAEIEQASSAQSTPFNFLSKIDSETNTKIRNTVTNNANISDEMNCAAGSSQLQEVVVEKVGGSVNFENNSMEQTTKVVADCMMKSDLVNSIASEFDNEIQQSARASGTLLGIDFGEIAGMLGPIGIVIMGVVIVGALVFIGFLIYRGVSGKESKSQQALDLASALGQAGQAGLPSLGNNAASANYGTSTDYGMSTDYGASANYGTSMPAGSF